ncbi:hypothetical protein Y032_0026g1298 [Ancylostoma ceylanicum]|uniref:Reverse transcriptase domain-containing protein n=1 Tax=Ancylostoma ceylanicum TaxID=53326 RepID=A0A016UV37_9BILA|nr:hypothetical protein Y032_0026g1298 [Ancylostoma ceylanicum]
MPRFTERRTWKLLQNVPAKYFRLVREALSLRQKIVSARQATHFLRRCLQHRLVPNFIGKKRLYETCGLPRDSQQTREIELHILRTAMKTKQDQMYTMLKKCVSKELYCERFLPSHLWRSITSESKSICDSIRANVKSKLQEKFNRLLDQKRPRTTIVPVTATSCEVHHLQAKEVSGAIPCSSRVTVIGGITLSCDAHSVLSLGPSFSPTQSICPRVVRKIVGSLQYAHDRLRYQAKLESHQLAQPPNRNTRLPALPFPSMFFKPQEPNSHVDSAFRLFTTSVFATINQFLHKRPTQNLTPAQIRGLKEIRDLTSSGAIKISISDKGGEFVVMPKELERKITRLHLQDETLYALSSEKEFRKQYRRLNRVWVETAQSVGIPKATIARLKCDHPVCPVLYVLIKTHKLSPDDVQVTDPSVFKIRPIVSNIGGPTDRVSWLLNIILAQVLHYVPAHLSSTNAFLDQLRHAQFGENDVMESFDVTSLYTNVSTSAAMEAVFELLSDKLDALNLYGFSIAQIMTLVKECLSCSVFRWSGQYFKQTRGLAMGQRLAPTLAIAFMAKVENPVLERRPTLYCRYIDDCFIVCPTQAEMDACFDLLNNRSEHIKFTREKPRENWLAFLNIQVCLTNGDYRTRWYRKPSSKNILIHYLSAHPVKTKRSVIANMIHTARTVSSDNSLKADSADMAFQIAQSNGYPLKNLPRPRCGRTRVNPAGLEGDKKVPFCLPFISDQFSKAIRACVRRSGLEDSLRVVEIPPTSLKQRLVSNRAYDRSCNTKNCIICPGGRPGDCATSGVIYLITCKLCGEEYIGETGRPLGVRIQEHLDGLQKSKLTTPLGTHRRQRHDDGEFGVDISILAREVEISARKTLEAFWIFAKSPKMNRKDECIAITNELAPFAGLCGF